MRGQANVAGESVYNGNSGGNGPYRPVRSGQSEGWLNMSVTHWNLTTEPKLEGIA